MSTDEGENVLIGVIGGSGLYHLDNLTFIKHVNPETPWGHPSAPITICALPSGTRIAFLARHGLAHTIPPSRVPARANIAALKSLGVRAVLAFSAVGSLREDIPPGSFALPTQIIDRTKGVRPASFFEDTSVVAHAAFGDPVSARLVRWLEGRIGEVLRREGRGVRLFADKTIVCMEGPQFSTRAESLMYRQWGGDLINMSVLPEAKLAREAELSYALVATATDYDSWRPHEGAVTAAEVFKTLQANADTARRVVATILEDLHVAISNSNNDANANHPGASSGADPNPNASRLSQEGADILLEEVGSMRHSIMPRTHRQKPEDIRKLAYILPEYFSVEDDHQASSHHAQTDA